MYTLRYTNTAHYCIGDKTNEINQSRADLHVKPPSTMGHESLNSKEAEFYPPGLAKIFFFRHTIRYSKLPYA